MTTDDPQHGRPAATPLPRADRAGKTLPFLLAAALSGLAMPALGAGLAGDSADQLPQVAHVSQSLTQPLPAAMGRELLFAADVNQLIAAGAGAAGPEPERAGRQNLLQRGLALLGTPYRWGGTSPEGGFDCSGLVSYLFRTALGIELPRVSHDMASAGEQVERTQLDAGDLVFFARRAGRIDHVGIYLGNGRFLHAPRTGRDVTVSSLDTGYWSRKFTQARRIGGV
ncbi:C40 family peptidase [Luteimonas sp. RD2P54]|uniref:C40 family peptidase n=1 Tax=Luteimonas endophytica TaxID=3042023 RepID=A0ABT6JC62_9GAMM|nr:C40 family peptidase [Luteimonas endophytica]MDH5824416.1 C40 family peptidase [Luteimonas endophytica]